MRALAAVALALLALLAPARPARAASEPLHIAADNVTGSHDPSGDVVLLNGNVRITRGGTVITADQGSYRRALGLLDLFGHIRMVDSASVVTCDHVSYSEQTDVLQLDGNVVLHDHEATLHAPSGTYDRRLGRADLAGPVRGEDRDLVLTSDRAVYFRDSSLVQALGHVRAVDEKNKTVLTAEIVNYDRARRVAVATGNPALEATDDEGRVAVMRALRMRVDTGRRIAEALDSVRVTRDTLQASGQYGRFDDVAQRGILVGHPRVWDDQTVVTGDTLEVFTEKRVLKRAILRPHAVVEYAGNRPGTVGETNRLTGDRVDVLFTHDDIDSLVATGHARDEYQSVARAGETPEHNETTGDTITVFFQQRKIDRAVVQGDAKGIYHLAVSARDTAAARRETVAYDGRSVQFQVQKNRIVLDGDAHLTYADLELTARKVTFDVDKQTLVAAGKPVLNDRGDRVTGGLMTYDLESRVGTIYEAQTTYEKGLYHGEAIRKVGENELDVMNGNYSTCDLARPHYHFSARWMKIYLKDKLVAKPVVFYVKNVPLLALPFWVFPIKPGRHSGFLFPQFELGFSNRAGQFLRNAGYYWAPNDYFDITASGDYYSAEPSWVLRGDGEYSKLYLLNGSVHGTFARNENPVARREDWDFSADHAQDLGLATRLVGRAQFVSSRDYSTSAFYGRTLADRVNRFLVSSLSVSHTAGWASITGFVDRRQDLDADQSLRDLTGTGVLKVGDEASTPSLQTSTPSLQLLFPSRTIGDLGPLRGSRLGKALQTLNFSLNARFLQLGEHVPYVSAVDRDSAGRDTAVAFGERVTTRRGGAANAALFDARRAFGWLSIRPVLNVNTVVFDFDELGHRVVPAATWSSAMNVSSTFYGTFRPRLFGIEGVRHVIAPNLSITYSPEFHGLLRDSSGQFRNRFTPFGDIAISGARTEVLGFSLDQRLQAKVRRHGQTQRLDNLISLSTAGTYNFLWRELGLLHPLSQLGWSMFVQPPGVMSATFNWTTDPYSRRPLRDLRANVGFNIAHGGGRHSATPELPVDQASQNEPTFAEDWSMGLSYSYGGGYAASPTWSSRQTGNAVARWQFSPAWGIEYTTSADLTLRRLTTQHFGITRDLHCWEASFTRSFTIGGEAEYYFRLAVKDQKEIYLERGTRTGSIGGIQ